MAGGPKAEGPHYLRFREEWIGLVAKSPNLSHLAVRVGVYLAIEMSVRTRDAHPHIDAVARAVNASAKGVHSAVRQLRAAGFLGVEPRRNAGNRYWLLPGK